jgi:FdhE protein
VPIRHGEDGWARRAARARALAVAHSAVADTLGFYAALAELQGRVAAGLFADVPTFAEQIAGIAPPPLADALHALKSTDADWRQAIDTYWKSGGREPADLDHVQQFLIEAWLQPVAEAANRGAGTEPDGERPLSLQCPRCTGIPVVALLRERGHGAQRSFVCGVCLAEWTTQRLVCPDCGESTFDKLPVFRADTLATARIDACDTCRTYIKTIDLTRDGNAEPIADDIATVALDLWAREQGYRRARLNLLRL